MKRILSMLLVVALLCATMMFAVSCKNEVEKTWDQATYQEDTTFGSGAKTVTVVVKFNEFAVNLTVKTDREMLGDALLDHGLIAGEEGPYGLYVKTVNGILADFDVDQSYWALQQNGENLMTGVDSTPIVDGAVYELVYTR